MSILGFGKSAKRYGIILDIGSGSVLAAIVCSDPMFKHPQIIWYHREYATLRDVDSLDQSAKAVMTALVNSSMKLDSEGRKMLYNFDKTAKLTEVQCGISAPWSYTVTKNINYHQDQEFEITKSLISELTKTIEDKIESDVQENEKLLQLGLQVTTHMTMSLLANGYKIKKPIGGSANSLVIARSSVVTQEYLIEAVNEMCNKLFTGTECRKMSFILVLYQATKTLLSVPMDDVCLIDITFEATEIGVVRDGVLNYCTHTPFGIYSLAREIATVTKVPLSEAFGYLHHEDPYFFLNDLNKQQKNEIDNIFESYVIKLTDLFHETGDALSIPKYISLHTDLRAETLFRDLIEKAVKRCIKTEPHITSISDEIIKKTYQSSVSNDIVNTVPIDTAILLSAYFFHTQTEYEEFDYL